MTAVSVARLSAALAAAGLLVESRGTFPVDVTGLTDDSREVERGGLFIAIRGASLDGNTYLRAAAAAGAAVVVAEQVNALADLSVPALVVSDARRSTAVLAAAFHGDPGRQLSLIGVTGTNGKTTTTAMIRHLLDSRAAPSASIGTLGVLVGSAGAPLPGGRDLTTPGPIELQRVLRALVDHGVKSVVMEVSSHALHQQRVEGLRFDAAVFTNLTRDHLDYHRTMEDYFAAKALLVKYLAPLGVAVRNADDPAWAALSGAPRWCSYGVLDAAADVAAREVVCDPRGSNWVLSAGGRSAAVRLPLIGDFNVTNAVAAAATALSLGRSLEEVAAGVGSMPQVPGRLEIIGEHPTVLRDYAHTPDALERALRALRSFVEGRIVVVFGAGGDRDRGKRPLMGRVAAANADLLVVTSDNPRTEDPESIIDEIVAPLSAGRYERIESRRAAIGRAIALADPERDVVLLAGKGHETYQIRGTVKLPFDERDVVRECLIAR